MSLTTLPTELLLTITTNFHPEETASLALTCHTLLHKLGATSFSLQSPQKYNLLRLASKDGIYPHLIVCPLCHVFHTPFPLDWWRRAVGDQISMRLCETSWHSNKSESWDTIEIISPELPPQTHFNMVAAVMRCHRFGWPGFGPEVLNSGDRVEIGGWRIHRYHDFGIRGGHLLLKAERLVWLKEGENLAEAVEILSKAVAEKKGWKFEAFCGHLMWARDVGVLKGGCVAGWEGGIMEGECGECNRDHGKEIGRVKTCGKCYTDYAVAFVDMPDGKGKVCVLTTWKDLGSGERLESPEWRSHLRVKPPPPSAARQGSPPSVYLAWDSFAVVAKEGKAGTDMSPGYDPLIRPQRLETLTQQ
ncbi:hypothetical protein OQA88_2997 [Cercophora sp. LCS_1]